MKWISKFFKGLNPFGIGRFVGNLVKLLLILAIAGAIWLVIGLYDDESLEEARAHLLSAEESSLLVTSLARVDVFRAKVKGKWEDINVLPLKSGSLELKEIQAFCMRTYDVSFGYPNIYTSVRDAKSDNELRVPVPRIVSLNQIKSYEYGDNAIEGCLSAPDGDRALAAVKDALSADQVLIRHLLQGQRGFISLLNIIDSDCGSKCDPALLRQSVSSEWEKQDAEFLVEAYCDNNIDTSNRCRDAKLLKQMQEGSPSKNLSLENYRVSLRAGDFESAAIGAMSGIESEGATGGYFGSIILTFSTHVILQKDRRVRFLWVFPLWKKDTFFFQRELAEVTYGTYVSPENLSREISLRSLKQKLVLTVPKPQIIAVNRKLRSQGYRGNLKELEADGESVSGRANSAILEAMQNSIERFESYAIAHAKGIARQRLSSENITLKFTDDESQLFGDNYFEAILQ